MTARLRAVDRANAFKFYYSSEVSASAREVQGTFILLLGVYPATVSEDPDLETVAGLLEDKTAQAILTETSTRPMSANALAERCDASGPTIYRRLERLRDCDLVVERTDPDPDGGHHRTVYVATLDSVEIELTPGGFEVVVSRRDRAADRFTTFVEGLHD